MQDLYPQPYHPRDDRTTVSFRLHGSGDGADVGRKRWSATVAYDSIHKDFS